MLRGIIFCDSNCWSPVTELVVRYLMHHLQFTLSYFSLQMNLYTFSYQKVPENMNVLLSICKLCRKLRVLSPVGVDTEIFAMAIHCFNSYMPSMFC